MAADTVVVDIELKGFGKAQKGLDELTKKQIEQKDAIKLTTQQIKFYEKTLSELETAKVKNGKLTEEESKKQSEYQQKLQSSNVTLATQKDELAKVNTQRRTAVKDVDTYNTALKAEKGSNEQLKAQLKLLTAEYNGLSKEQRDNTEEGKLKGKQLKALTEKLKENESAVGDNRRNVGNYTESIREAFGNTEIFGVSLNGLRDSYQATKDTTTGLIKNLVVTDSVIKSQEESTKGMTTAQKALNVATISGKVAMNVFKLALIATGIGAFVVAIGSLVAYFTQTQKGAEVLRKVMSGLGATMDVLTDRLSSFGGGIAKIFSGDFSGGFEDMQESFKGIGDEIQREVELVTELENKLIALEKREIAASVARSEVNKQIKEQNRLAEDTNQSLEVRLAAANKVLDLEKEQIKIENDLANQQLLNALQLEGTYEDNIDNINAVKQAFIDSQDDVEIFNELLNIGISETTVGDVKEIADAIISNNNAIAASEEVLTTAQNKRNIIQQAIATGQEKAITDSQTASDKNALQDKERLASLNEILRTEKETLEFEKNKLLEELKLSEEGKVLTQTEADAKKAIIDKYNQDVAELEQNAIKESQELNEKALDQELQNQITDLQYLKNIKLEDDTLTNEQRLQIERDYQKDKANLMIEELGNQAALIKAELEQLSADGSTSLIKPLTPEEETALKEQLNLVNEKIAQAAQTINGIEGEEAGLNLLNGLGLDEAGSEKLNFAFQTISTALTSITDLMGAASERNKKLIQEQADQGVISQDEADKKIQKIEKRAFKRQKAMQIAMAIVSTSQAVLAALSQTTDFTPTQSIRTANAIAAGVFGGAQIATIAAQKFQDGGMINGNSHANGGVPFTVAGRGGFEAEGGEFITNKRAVSHYGTSFMDAVNNMQIPKIFADGGLVAPAPVGGIGSQVSQSITEGLAASQGQRVEVINVESDFSNIQNRVNNVEQSRTY